MTGPFVNDAVILAELIMEKHNDTLLFKKPNRTRAMWSFTFPHQLVSDPSIEPEEKRGILAAWASDAHAVDSLPVLRHLPGTPFPVTFSSIMNAMAELDRLSCANEDDPPPPARAKRSGVRLPKRRG